MGALAGLVRYLVNGLAVYAGLKFAETTFGPSPVTVNTNGGGVVQSIADKIGIKSAFVWIGIVAVALFVLRYFFKQKTI